MKTIVTALSLLAVSFSSYATSDVCGQERTLTKEEFCSNLNTTNNPEDNPYIYLDPNSKCDLGLQLPGLPDFGLDIDSISGCEVAQMVTSESVRDLNNSANDAVNDVEGEYEYDPGEELEDIVDEQCEDGRCF